MRIYVYNNKKQIKTKMKKITIFAAIMIIAIFMNSCTGETEEKVPVITIDSIPVVVDTLNIAQLDSLKLQIDKVALDTLIKK
jgi:hypothetical protein